MTASREHRIKKENTQTLLNKIETLGWVMTATFTEDNNITGVQNRLFSDDELLEYKAKMVELIKQL
jgi:hypothetical protein